MSEFKLVEAVKSERALKMAIDGPTGSGKTLTALYVASGLAPGVKPTLIDTENKSSSLYANLVKFSQIDLSAPFSPERYCAAIRFAEREAPGSPLIIDSLSHAWNAEGGVLEMADRFDKWKTATPEHQSLLRAIIQSDLDIIVTMRTDTEWVIEKDQNGKNVPRKVGTKATQRKDVEYEFDIVARLDTEHVMEITKTRLAEFDRGVYKKPGAEFGAKVKAALSGAPREVTASAPAATAIPDALKPFIREHYGIKPTAQLEQWLAREGVTTEQAVERWVAEAARASGGAQVTLAT